MKKSITKALLFIFSFGVVITLSLNLFVRIYLDKKNFIETAMENFLQIERILEENERELAQTKADFAEDCIIRARAAAYIAEHTPEIIDDIDKCKYVAGLLQVDELHFFNPEGTIYAGTQPQYYGFNVSSGEQIAFFAPMLNDYSLELCQDITPNTAEQKLMQYAAVWRQDHVGIVQVGLEPERVLKAIEGNDVSEIFSLISTDHASTFYALDAENNVILGSTALELVGKSAQDIGMNLPKDIEGISEGYFVDERGEKQYYAVNKVDSLILVKTCSVDELHDGIIRDSLILCIYFVALFMTMIGFSYVFLDRKIIRSIYHINGKLKEISYGKWDTTLQETSTPEFAELSSYINDMVDSLVTFFGKMSKALELSKVPIGICEYVPETKRFTATSRVKEILMLTDAEFDAFKEQPEKFEEKMQEICLPEACLEENIYRLKRDRETYIRVEVLDYKGSKMSILTDVTADIQKKQEIAKERDTDLLTGLYNSRAFYSQMDHLMANPAQIKNAVMIMVDLDNLKKVNDTYGHAEGDRYLQKFADYLHSCGTGNTVAARMGGDEFTLFAYGMENRQEINHIIEEFLSFRDTYEGKTVSGDSILLEYSMGWAFYPEEEAEYHHLIALADKRMYEDKKNRKEKRRN